jgi:putative ABC transport system substrate-binding protein
MGLLSGAAVTWPRASPAQQGKTFRVGYLALSGRGVPWIDAWLAGMNDAGYQEGKNLVVEWGLAAGNPELLPAMAAEMVRRNVDVIVAGTSAGGVVAQRATQTIPVVVLASHDGIGRGLYASLARPGANVTGVESLSPALDVKRVEIMRELLPGLKTLAIFFNSSDPGSELHIGNARQAAEQIGITVQLAPVASVEEFDRAFAAIATNRPDALLVIDDGLVLNSRARVAGLFTRYDLPTIHEFAEWIPLGGLASYGASLIGMWRRGAYYVDRILKGDSPANLPVEQPTVFELAINIKRAKQLGISVPDTLIARADKVIE